jgi:hypothetical protein
MLDHRLYAPACSRGFIYIAAPFASICFFIFLPLPRFGVDVPLFAFVPMINPTPPQVS